jgi:hypothetical protein
VKTSTALVIAGAVGVAILLYEKSAASAAVPVVPQYIPPPVPTAPAGLHLTGADGVNAGTALLTGNYFGAAKYAALVVTNPVTQSAAKAAGWQAFSTISGAGTKVATTAKKALDTVTFGVL